jgi:hypothetical protein
MNGIHLRRMSIHEWFKLMRFRKLLYREIVQWAAADFFTAIPPLYWDVDIREHIGIDPGVSNTIEVQTLILHTDGTEEPTQAVAQDYPMRLRGLDNKSTLGKGAVYSYDDARTHFDFGKEANITIWESIPGSPFTPLHSVLVDAGNGRMEFIAEDGHRFRITRHE